MALRDAAVGRYLYLTIEGVVYRVYYEEAGSGVPLLVQHTAGASAAQWRHLLEDRDVTRDFRVIAYDLPYHGKSLPPAGIRWWEQEYRLTHDFFARFVLTLTAELELGRPVFLGVSMGGLLATDLALHHPERFRAFIAVEAAHENHGLDDPLFHHPRISDNSKAAIMYCVMGPDSPEPCKRETAWLYAQAAPDVLLGDLYYNCVEHDLVGKAHAIDTAKAPVYLLSGEWDWGMTPDRGRALAADIQGAEFREMTGLGHFPMSENPEEFRRHLLPILEQILRNEPHS